MTLNELIETLKLHQDKYGNNEVVTYHSLPTHSNPHFGNRIIFVDSAGDNILSEISWNSTHKTT